MTAKKKTTKKKPTKEHPKSTTTLKSTPRRSPTLAKKAVRKKAARKKAAPRKALRAAPVSRRAPSKTGTNFAFDTIEQIEHFSAPPEILYRAWLDSAQHSAFTGGRAEVEPFIGGAFSAWDEYITGTTTELVPNERIVQKWRARDFPVEYPDSRLELTFTPESGGTKLRLRQTTVPRKNAKSYDSGWHQHYWQPLRAYLAQLD